MLNFRGVVEDVNDPLKLGRVKVRVIGKHSDSLVNIPTEDLPWAIVAQPTTSPATSGVGQTPFLVKGTHVIGLFTDPYLQDLIVTHTIPGIPETEADVEKGFNDPDGVYPKEDHLNESDLNRLARNENVDKTIITEKRETVSENIDAGGQIFSEPKTEFDSVYPFNKVLETESGHVVEYDDTPGAERIHHYHKSGSFIEVFPDGRRVLRIVSDDFEIVHSDKNLYVKGDVNIRVDGNVNLKIAGNARTEINGDETKTVNGNMTLNVLGAYEENVGGDIRLSAGGKLLGASGGIVGFDGSNTFLQSGSSSVKSPTKAKF